MSSHLSNCLSGHKTSTKQRIWQRPAETNTKPAQNSETGRDQERDQHKISTKQRNRQRPAETSTKPAQKGELGHLSGSRLDKQKGEGAEGKYGGEELARLFAQRKFRFQKSGSLFVLFTNFPHLTKIRAVMHDGHNPCSCAASARVHIVSPGYLSKKNISQQQTNTGGWRSADAFGFVSA